MKSETMQSRSANAIAQGVPASGTLERSTPAAATAAVTAGCPVAAVVTAGRNGSVREAPNRPAATDGPSPPVAFAMSATLAEQRTALRTAERTYGTFAMTGSGPAKLAWRSWRPTS
jgi:hypothetical protein